MNYDTPQADAPRLRMTYWNFLTGSLFEKDQLSMSRTPRCARQTATHG